MGSQETAIPDYKELKADIFQGDWREQLQCIPDDSIDLIITVVNQKPYRSY